MKERSEEEERRGGEKRRQEERRGGEKKWREEVERRRGDPGYGSVVVRVQSMDPESNLSVLSVCQTKQTPSPALTIVNWTGAFQIYS